MHYITMNVYTCLHGDREVSLSLRREVDINSLLGEGLVALSWGANLNNVKLRVEGKGKEKNSDQKQFLVPNSLHTEQLNLINSS